MNLRSLGRTGLAVSEVGFGCGNIGGLMVRGAPSEQAQGISRALELGINYFDTAPAYGEGRSETNLGQVLRELGSQAYVGTKFRVAPEEVEDAGPRIRGSLEASLNRLRRNYVDILQLHNPVVLQRGGERGALSYEDVLGPVLEGLRAVQAAGLARFIGFTGLGDPEAIRRVVASGAFDTVQVYFNALNPSAGYSVGLTFTPQNFRQVIDEAAAAGTGVLVIRAMAAGALGDSGERHPLAGSPGAALSPGSDYDSDLQRAYSLEPLAKELGMEGTAELGMRFALSKTGVSTVLMGFSDLAQVQAAVGWAERGGLGEDAIQRVLQVIIQDG